MSESGHVGGFSYPWYWNLVAFGGALFDLLFGLWGHVQGLVRRPRVPEGADTASRRRRGLTLILGGIEGPSQYSVAMVRGVLASGYGGAVVRVDWNRGLLLVRLLRNLMSRRHHERQSDRLVEKIVRHRAACPESPVCLLAQSGGCWIVVRALEKLPAGVTVRAAVLLCPAISTRHDLSEAALRCDGALVSVRGPCDLFLLGIGTTLFGTSDRVHGPAAGWIGWRVHPERLVDLRWHPRWLRYGYWGSHVTTSAVGFIAHVIAPYFKGGAAGRAEGMAGGTCSDG